MKPHIGADEKLGLVHSVAGAAANAPNSHRPTNCCTDTKTGGADASYTSTEKRTKHEDREIIWQIAAPHQKPGKRSALHKAKRKIEKKQDVTYDEGRAPAADIKHQLGYMKTRLLVTAKNTAQLATLLTQSNL